MNAPLISPPRVLPFFFDSEPGTRFSLYHAPDPHVKPRGAILYVHPFAEELNRSRRMAAVQARAFAAMGFAVLQIDMFGCGDSCGDFVSGRWELWKADLAVACAWLAERSAGPLHLWGLRLGGLLALDFACTRRVDSIILWHPYINGRTCINQFLRLGVAANLAANLTSNLAPNPAPNVASDMAADPEQPAPELPHTTAAIRAQLAARPHVEVAGYELAPALVKSIDACDAANLRLPPCSVHWFANGAPAPSRVEASAARLAERWALLGVTVHFHPVDGVAFWADSGVVECPALLAATSAVFAAKPE